jgi:hypothetical protein
MSPCQVPSRLRRITLTTPSLQARLELVAQWANAVNLCGVDRPEWPAADSGPTAPQDREAPPFPRGLCS